MIDGDDHYIPLDEAQRQLRLSRRQVYRLASDGRIRTLPTRRGQVYSASDVARLAAEGGAERRAPIDDAEDETALARRQAADLAPIRADVGALRQLAQETRDEIVELRRSYDPATRQAAEQELLARLAAVEAAQREAGSRARLLTYAVVALAVAVVVAALILAFVR